MASSYTKITIIGHLGRDPESRMLPNGEQVTEFSVATSEQRRNTNGPQQDVTTWFRVSAFGRLAEIAGQFLHTGSAVYLEGSLAQRSYTDRSGQQRTSLDVRARELRLLDRRGDVHPPTPSEMSPRLAASGASVPDDETEYPF